MDLLYIGQTGFKDMDLCFNKILKPTDTLVQNETVVTVTDELLIQRLLATGRYKETTVEEKIEEIIIEEEDDEDLEEIIEDEDEED